MSDYLQNLAARSLDMSSVVEPRLASFFERPVHSSRLPANPVFDDEHESNRASERSDETVGNDMQAQQRRAMRADLRPLTETFLLERKTPDNDKLRDDSLFPLQREPKPDSLPESTSFSTKEATSRLSPQIATSMSNNPFTNLTSELKSESFNLPSGVLESLAEREPKVGRLPSEHLVALEPIRTDDVAGPEPLRPVERQAAASISVGPRDANFSVKVTIGRVDVRAIMPQRAAAAPAAPAPSRHRPVSLDDYLKQRAGGKQ